MKFELLDIDANLFRQRTRDVFKSLVDTNVSYPSKDTKDGFLKSIPSNYGYVFFWFGFLHEETLTKYYRKYVSKEKLKEIEETREKEEEYFSLKDHVREELFPIVYDHPDTIGNGFAEVHLAILNVDFKKTRIDKGIPILRRLAKNLEKLNDFVDRANEIEGLDYATMEIKYETIKFADSRATEEEIGALIYGDEEIFEEESEHKHVFRRDGWEISLNVNFNGDETLRDVVEKIDKIISPLKRIVNKMTRYESSFSPF